MAVPFIREAVVSELLDMPSAVAVVERAMRDQAAGLAATLPRTRLQVAGASLHMVAASWEGGGVYGQKIYSIGPGGSQFWVLLYALDGRPFAVVEAQGLGRIRTGAASGVATKVLARPDARRLGLIGSGYQMRTQLEAVCAVREIASVRAWSPTRSRLEAFCAEMSARLERDVVPVESVAAAVAGADVVVTLTTSPTPVLSGSDLEPGMHLNAAGSNRADHREIDVAAVARAHRIVVDDVAQARTESGNLIAAAAAGVLAWDDVVPLAQVVADPSLGRSSGEDVTIFASHGIGLWDVATAAWVAERAVAEGRAELVDLASGPDPSAPARFRPR